MMFITDFAKPAIQFLLLTTLTTATVASQQGTLASVEADAYGVSVTPLSGDALQVTIVGPDTVLEQKLNAGESGYLQAKGKLPDGYYNYEIKLIPDSASMVMVETNGENGRPAMSPRAMISGPTLQTGGFRLTDGTQMVPAPDQVERP